jgi:hypothetical protein
MKVTICTLCLSHWLGLCRFFDFHRKPRLNSEFTAQRNVRRGREFSSKMLTRICASHCSVVVRPMPDRSSIADATLPSKTPVFGRSIGRMYRTRRSAHGRKRPHLRTSAHSSTCSAGRLRPAGPQTNRTVCHLANFPKQLRETSQIIRQ